MNEEFNPYNNSDQTIPQPTAPADPVFSEPSKSFPQQEVPQFVKPQPPVQPQKPPVQPQQKPPVQPQQPSKQTHTAAARPEGRGKGVRYGFLYYRLLCAADHVDDLL